MDSLFYSPNGSSWNLRGPEVHIDPSTVVTMPVRKYTFQNTKYAILACAELSFPNDIFYMLSIMRPNGTDVSSTQESDFKIIKQLMKYAPVNVGQYKVAEHKLMRKIANRKHHAYVASIQIQNELMASVKADMKDDKNKNESFKTTNVSQSVQITAADDDASDGLCGIMGVYCGSGIHGDYHDTREEDERKIA